MCRYGELSNSNILTRLSFESIPAITSQGYRSLSCERVRHFVLVDLRARDQERKSFAADEHSVIMKANTSADTVEEKLLSLAVPRLMRLLPQLL